MISAEHNKQIRTNQFQTEQNIPPEKEGRHWEKGESQAERFKKKKNKKLGEGGLALCYRGILQSINNILM